MKNLFNRFKNQDSFFSIVISAIFFLILAVLSPYFFKSSNLLSLQAVIAPRVIIAIGMMVVLIIGMFDLSVGSIMGFSGIVCGYLLGHGNSIVVSVLAGLGTGILIGLINGLLIAVGNIPPLIVTIGTMYIFRGFAEMIMTSDLAMSLTGFPQEFLDFGDSTFLGVYNMVWIMLVLLVIIELVLKRTYIGRSLYYIGGNKTSAISLGFNVKWATIGSFVLSGFLSALAGVLSIARFQSASRYLGQGIQIDILIACIIGGGSLLGGKGDMKGAFFGTVFIALLVNAFNLFEINSLFKSVVVGGALVLVVLFDGYIYLRKMRALGKV
jgi:ribose/xylose/arabinose/galactoside ABC-type transport system permease subunit